MSASTKKQISSGVFFHFDVNPLEKNTQNWPQEVGKSFLTYKGASQTSWGQILVCPETNKICISFVAPQLVV